MKKIYIVVLSLVLVMISILLVFLPCQRYVEKIVSASTILAGLAAIATLIVALLLYNKFTIDQSIFEKQGDAVIRLLLRIRTKSFILKSSTKAPARLHLGIMAPEIIDQIVNRSSPESLLLVRSGFFDYLGEVFDQTKDGIYIPNEIARVIVPSNFFIRAWNVTDDKPVVHLETHPSAYDSINKYVVIKDDTDFILTNGEKDMTLAAFIDRWNEIIQTIENWIRKNAPAAVKTLGL